MSGMWKAYEQKNTIPTIKAWRWVIDDVVLFLKKKIENVNHGRVCSIMDSQKYQVILKKNIMPSADKLNLGDLWTFQKDKDPKHTAKSIKAKCLWVEGICSTTPLD